MIEIESCPLEHKNGNWEKYSILVKPPTAGVRILTLDGGGVRGIAEL